jgi:hypothetical protein
MRGVTRAHVKGGMGGEKDIRIYRNISKYSKIPQSFHACLYETQLSGLLPCCLHDTKVGSLERNDLLGIFPLGWITLW